MASDPITGLSGGSFDTGEREADDEIVADDTIVERAQTTEQLVAAGDYRALWMSLLAVLPRCSDGCERTARFMTTYSGQFSCGMTDRGCAEPDGDEWEDAPWKAHVDAAGAHADRGAR